MFMTNCFQKQLNKRLSVTKESDFLIDKRNAEETLHQKKSKLGTDVIGNQN